MTGSTTPQSQCENATPSGVECAGQFSWAVGPLGCDRPGKARVLFFTDNGHGLGHITRLAAIARRLPEDVTGSFLTLSESSPLLTGLGFPAEHLPSRDRLGVTTQEWDAMMRPQLRHVFETVRPTVVVLDHGAPPAAVTSVARQFGARLVWSRRGLWKPWRNRTAVELEADVDLVLEPGDLAAPIDRGATRARPGIHRLRPITLVDREDLLPRPIAREQLGIPADDTTILLQLTADTGEGLRRLRDRLVRELHGPGVTCFTPLHPLHHDLSDPPDDVTERRVYPISRYLNAFDAAISMSGYNSFHELILGQVPTLFLTRRTQSVDDQARRARFAQLAGMALQGDEREMDVRALVDLLLDRSEAARMRTVAQVLYPGNGAIDAARIISDLATGHES